LKRWRKWGGREYRVKKMVKEVVWKGRSCRGDVVWKGRSCRGDAGGSVVEEKIV
jgi:hypothetical protein